MTKLYLFHGAGAGHKSEFLTDFKALLQHKIALEVETFTLQYMQEKEALGKKRPPPPINKLIEEASQTLDKDVPLVLIGKSMGSRIIAELCETHNVIACVALGFPFYPAKKPEKDRLYHLHKVEKVPFLIVQGTRDSLGSYDWIMEHQLASNICFHWIEGADHDFNVLKRYNRSKEDVLAEVADVVSQFVSNAMN